jgi:Transglycosylase SLT domain
MNKVNLILLIIAMFTGFPAIVAVSQNITVATPSEAYFSQSSSSIVQTTSSNIILSSQLTSSSSQIASSSSNLVSNSSSIVLSSPESKPKIIEVEAPKEVLKVIEVKSLSSASKIMADIKKSEITKEITKIEAKPVIKQEIKIESKIALPIEEIKSVAKVIDTKPIAASSSSITSSSSSVTLKTNLTFAEQITNRCEVLGCNATQLIRVMKCESSGNPMAVGSGLYIGLFQFLPSTFNVYKVKAGLPNGDIYNGIDQIYVAAYMFANGQAGQWGCK